MIIHVAVCASGDGVAEARVLAASVRQYRSEWPVTVLVLGGGEPITISDDEPFSVLRLGDLRGPPVLDSLIATPHLDQPRIAGPALVEHLLDAGDDAVMYLAPDTFMLAAPIELELLLDEHDAVILPRVRRALPDDGERPDAADLVEAGEVEDGLFAVRRTERGRRVAEWLADRARESTATFAAAERSRFQAPSRIAASPPLAALRALDGVTVLEHPGYGVSAWNLHERPLARTAQGTIAAGSQPARLMRFSGFRADRPWWLADFATRTPVLDHPVLEELCTKRATALRAAGWSEKQACRDQSRPRLGNGLRFDVLLRRLHHDALDQGEDFGDVFDAAGAEAFADWLNEPSPHGAEHGLTRYHHEVWLSRPDIVEAYPDLSYREVAEGFIGWLWVYGRDELAIQEALLPPRPALVAAAPTDPPAILVTGYLRGVVGLGEAARRYVSALDAAGVALATHVLPTDPPTARSARSRPRAGKVQFEDRTLPEDVTAEIHLLCTNADQTPDALEDVPIDRRPAYTIGNWAWETDLIPSRWDRIFKLVDELWVYSSWIGENIGHASPVPVIVMPTPVDAPDPSGARLTFEMPDAFTFLFTFDFFSTLERKNPIGLVEAFTTAFRPGEGPILLFKTINAGLRRAESARLQHAVAGRDDIRIVDGVLPATEQAALFMAADCYVSLHRAEGFGLTLAEAMSLGTPVIATGWSGNTDFMTIHNSFLVNYTLRLVGDNPPYSPDGTWAEASIEHAARLMRDVWEHQDAARERGARGRADVLRLLSPRAVGARARERLERIATFSRQDRGAESVTSSWLLEDVQERLHFDRLGNRPAGARSLAKRAVFRALRPYSAPQQELDDSLVDAVARIAIELEALRAARARDQRRIGELERRLADRRGA